VQELGSRPLDRNADDMLGVNNGEVIGAPLSHNAHVCYPLGQGMPGPVHAKNRHMTRPRCWAIDEYQTLREGLWAREASNALHPHYANQLLEPTLFMKIAYAHLMAGNPLRAGDFVALHGVLLSALQPNTYGMAKKWQRLMNCVSLIAKNNPDCKSVGY